MQAYTVHGEFDNNLEYSPSLTVEVPSLNHYRVLIAGSQTLLQDDDDEETTDILTAYETYTLPGDIYST